MIWIYKYLYIDVHNTFISVCMYMCIFLNIYLFIYLAPPRLSCGMQALLVAACELLVAACRIYFPDQGSNPGRVHWEHGVLATGPQGKSLHVYVYVYYAHI